jgi:hypothetical protein
MFLVISLYTGKEVDSSQFVKGILFLSWQYELTKNGLAGLGGQIFIQRQTPLKHIHGPLI